MLLYQLHFLFHDLHTFNPHHDGELPEQLGPWRPALLSLQGQRKACGDDRLLTQERLGGHELRIGVANTPPASGLLVVFERQVLEAIHSLHGMQKGARYRGE